MYKKILVPLDGSELAEQVLPQVTEMALCAGAEVVLVRVPVYNYEGLGMASTMPGAMPPQLIQAAPETRKQVEAYLARVRKELEERELAVSTIIQDGLPADVILACAEKEKVDLIAMSTHGRTGLGRMVFGSVADQVLRGAKVPVLLVRPESK